MIHFIYCPQCKAELDQSGPYPKCQACNITYYKNSKPAAGVLPIRGDKVLLAKRAIEPFKGMYDTIGGFLENGEHPIDGARREAKEETGLEIEPVELLGIYIDTYGYADDQTIYTLNFHYIGEIRGGTMEAQDDIASLEWRPIMEVPMEGFQNIQDALKDLQRWYQKRV